MPTAFRFIGNRPSMHAIVELDRTLIVAQRMGKLRLELEILADYIVMQSRRRKEFSLEVFGTMLVNGLLKPYELVYNLS
jgi:hypothetical protein